MLQLGAAMLFAMAFANPCRNRLRFPADHRVTASFGRVLAEVPSLLSKRTTLPVWLSASWAIRSEMDFHRRRRVPGRFQVRR